MHVVRWKETDLFLNEIGVLSQSIRIGYLWMLFQFQYGRHDIAIYNNR